MGMVILDWKMMLSTRISVNMCSVLWKKKCKTEWLMKSEQAPSLWTTSAVGCLSWGSIPEMYGQISRGKSQSLAPRQCPWKIKSFRGREEGWSFPARSKPPDMDLTSPGWKWNWSLGSTVKLSSWLDGGSKELCGVIYTGVYSQLCSIICFAWSSLEASTNLGTSYFTPRSTPLGPATLDLQCVLCKSVIFTISRYWIPKVPQLCASKMRHGTYLIDGCRKIVSNTICLPDRLFGGYQVVHVFAEKQPGGRGGGEGRGDRH